MHLPRLAGNVAVAPLPAAGPARTRACGPHEQIRAPPTERHCKARRAAGLTTCGRAMTELYAAPDSAFQGMATPQPEAARAAVDAGRTLRF